MDVYDPDRDPDAELWLELDEQERIALVEDYHLEAKIDVPSLLAHAAIHAIVETQLASGDPPGVTRTLARLLAAGVGRHDALHAIGSELAEQMRALALGRKPKGDVDALYVRSLERIDPRAWGGR